MIQNFNLFKNTKKTKDTQPDYTISAKIGERFVTIGSGWIKNKNGQTYLSCTTSNPYQDKDGYQIVPIHASSSPLMPPGQA